MSDLTDKVVLFTGASRGIGAATAVKFAAAGGSVVVNYFSHARDSSDIVARIRSLGGRAIGVRANVCRSDEVGALFDAAVEAFGRIEIVVANAGIWTGGEIDELDIAVWQETLDVNLTGVFNCCHFAARRMKQQRYGRIITVSSTAGQRGEACHSHYAASKGGIIALTKSLASELGSYGITVNCVAPGWVDTDMSAAPLRDRRCADKMVSGLWFLVSGFWSLVSGLWFLVSGFWSLVSGLWFLVSGFWSLVSGLWFLVSGLWSLVSGLWFLVSRNQFSSGRERDIPELETTNQKPETNFHPGTSVIFP